MAFARRLGENDSMRFATCVGIALVASGCGLTGEPRFYRPLPRAADASIDSESPDGSVVEADVAPVDASNDGAPSCDPPFQMCGELCVNTSTNVGHCGACGVACAAPANATATCVAGMCGLRCDPGRANCNSDPSDGCETQLFTDLNCGRCGMACPSRPNAENHCAPDGTTCEFVCHAGFSDCDGNQANGCESLNTAENCGACRTRCSGGTPVCVAGSCSSGCGALTRCGLAASSVCVSLATDPMHCGDCDHVCEAPANSIARCTMGTCGSTCATGWGNCDGAIGNGCETPTTNNVLHCGRCANACPTPPNAVPRCTAGACGFECRPGWDDCDGNPANGCETLLTSNQHCGACGTNCGLQICDASTDPARCITPLPGLLCRLANESLCDGRCVDLDRDPGNCGMCGNACPARTGRPGACSAGRCGFCPTGTSLCTGLTNFGQCCTVACLLGCTNPIVP